MTQTITEKQSINVYNQSLIQNVLAVHRSLVISCMMLAGLARLARLVYANEKPELEDLPSDPLDRSVMVSWLITAKTVMSNYDVVRLKLSLFV